jgi:ABC-2 type transport system ATP-binding protein
MLTDIIAPDRGTIRFFDEQLAPGPAVAGRLGYLPEERGLYPKMKVGEMVRFMGELRGLPAAVARQRTGAWLERLGLGKWTDNKVQDLSKGMQQKVQFATALIHDPELVILDEPWSGLDPINAEVLREVALELRAAGKTVLFSTHGMEAAEQLCDQIVIIARGRNVLSGRLADIRRAAAAERRVAVHLEDDVARGAATPVLADPALVASQRVPGDDPLRLELELAADASPQVLLAALVGAGAALRGFAVVTPSLHEIFVAKVGAENARGRGAQRSAGGGVGGGPGASAVAGDRAPRVPRARPHQVVRDRHDPRPDRHGGVDRHPGAARRAGADHVHARDRRSQRRAHARYVDRGGADRPRAGPPTWPRTIARATPLLAEVRAEQIDGFLELPPDALGAGTSVYRGANASSPVVATRLQQTVAAARAHRPRRPGRAVTQPAGHAVRRGGFRADHDLGDGESASGTAAMLVGYAVMLILYMAIVLYGVNVMRSVVQEKTTRVIELLVAVARPRALMLGKIFGVGAVGLVQIGVWLAMAVLTLQFASSCSARSGSAAPAGSACRRCAAPRSRWCWATSSPATSSMRRSSRRSAPWCRASRRPSRPRPRCRSC